MTCPVLPPGVSNPLFWVLVFFSKFSHPISSGYSHPFLNPQRLSLFWGLRLFLLSFRLFFFAFHLECLSEHLKFLFIKFQSRFPHFFDRETLFFDQPSYCCKMRCGPTTFTVNCRSSMYQVSIPPPHRPFQAFERVFLPLAFLGPFQRPFFSFSTLPS